MLTELLTPDRIQITERADDWRHAIALAAHPLLAENAISLAYIESMIDNVRELGPYIVITPRVAIPHASPDKGVNRMSISLLRVNEGVDFSEREGHKVFLLFVLAATDNHSHVQLLTELSRLLEEPENIDALLQADTLEDLMANLHAYTKERA